MKVFLKKQALQMILVKKNKSQNWLAYRMEISSGYISQLMDGKRCPSPKLRERMMIQLPECNFDDLFEISEHSHKMLNKGFK